MTMKKNFLTVAFIISIYYSYGQTDASENTTAIGLGASSSSSVYKFNYQTNLVPHFGLVLGYK